jgi:integrase-like protein
MPLADRGAVIDRARALTPACQQAFMAINLHWHDLRHEYASRLVERGVPLAQVRDLLGHASITTTERYDNQKLENLQAAVLKLESGKAFDASDTNRVENRVDDADKVSIFFKKRRKSRGSTMKRAIAKSSVSERIRVG